MQKILSKNFKQFKIPARTNALDNVLAIENRVSGFNKVALQSTAVEKANIRTLRNWAKRKGYIKKPGSGSNGNAPESWGTYEGDVFKERLKIDHTSGELKISAKNADETPVKIKFDGDDEVDAVEVAINKSIGRVDDVVKGVGHTVADLPKAVSDIVSKFSDEASKAKFLSDYFDDGSDVFRSAVDGNPKLVDSWKVFKDANLSDALRKNPANLESLSKALKQNGYNATYFENLLKSKTDPQKFIDDYVSKLGNDGKCVDNALEADYASYVSRKAREGKPPRDRAEWNEASDYMKYNSPTARGNRFNKKAELEYDINELNLVLDDGSFVRIDTNVPGSQNPTGQGHDYIKKRNRLG